MLHNQKMSKNFLQALWIGEGVATFIIGYKHVIPVVFFI